MPLLIFLALMPFISFGQKGGIIEQRSDLEKIKKEMEDCRKSLDSLQEQEKNTLKEISNYGQRASVNETVLKRLNRQLDGIKNNIRKSKISLDNFQEELNASRSRFTGNLKYYYTGLRWNLSVQSGETQKEKDALRRILYLRELAAFDRDQLSRASEYLTQAEKDYSTLLDREKTVGEARKKKKSEFILTSSQKEKREKELSKLRRKKEGESERLMALSEAARQMEDLIAQLEAARRDKKEGLAGAESAVSGNFVSYKGALQAPLTGKIIKAFGWSIDKITKLKSFSPGIEIVGEPNSKITAVADGIAAYVGNLRGYGTFVILEHEDGYFSTYAGIERLEVEQGEIISQGEKLGVSPSGIIKFELRHGKEPLDPIEWIKIDYFR